MYIAVSRGRSRHFLIMVGLLLMAILGVLGTAAIKSVCPQSATEATVSSADKAVICSLENAFSAIAERAEPGVISITALQRVDTGSGLRWSPELDAPEGFFERFLRSGFDEPFEDLQAPGDRDSPVTAAGSGMIVRRQGDDFYALTNYHLVESTYRVTVRLADGTELRAIVVGVDPMTDLAVVRMSSPMLSDRNVLPLGDSGKVRVGSWALAVGSPYGFEHTLTVGVVSGLHRQLEEDETMYPDLIQTDAAINKGNSGGPLLDVEGRIIGVNTAIASPTGGFIGLGFAIPVNTAKQVLDDLIEDGRVVRGWLGVGIQELTPVLQEYYGVKSGVLVASTDEKGPAAKAGIAGEDVIVRVGDVPVSDMYRLQKLVVDTRPGTTVPIAIVRGGKERTVEVSIGMSPLTPAGRPSPIPMKQGDWIRVRTLTDDLASRIGLRGTKGVIVVEVMAGSPAAEAGLEEGDIVVAMNGRAVTTEAEFQGMLKKVRSGSIVVLKVVRGRAPRMIGFRME